MEKNINVNHQEKHCYNINLRDNFNDFLPLLNNDVAKKYKKICIVTDTNVAKMHLENFKISLKNQFDYITEFIFEAGEPSKNLNTVQKLYEHLIINKFDRGDLLIALGGGVVGDMTGFTAATYLRGIDFIQVPTTLLSQVDSSIGGKTGVDFNQYKNMVGAFYMPKMVYINISTLLTLDNDQFACGMGEIIKHGLIKNIDYYEWLKNNVEKINSRELDTLFNMVYESCVIKRDVVEIDPTEKGIRSHLNFGHTLGHAIEKLSNFSLFHGQCVALGMISASYLSMRDGHISNEEYLDIINTIDTFNLPIKLDTSYNIDDIINASKSDKKMAAGKIKFIILNSIGCSDSYMDYNDCDLKEALNILF